jgi:hypothetical protein
MATVALQPASSKFARTNASKTLEKPIKLEFVRRFLSEEDFCHLKEMHPDGIVHVWGVKFERVPQWAKMFPRKTLVLFRNGSQVYLQGIVTFTTFNEELAAHLWGQDEYGDTWSLVYFLKSVKPIDIQASQVNEAAGLDPTWNWQGFNVVWPPASHQVIELIKDVVKNRTN